MTLCLAGLLAAGGVARAQQTPTSATPATATEAARAKVDLNTAEISVLEALPEIGPDMADAVVSGRPYRSVDEVARVLKLPPEKFATLRAKVFVSPPKASASTPRDPSNSSPSTPPKAKEGEAISAQEVTERYDRAQSAQSKSGGKNK